MTKKELECRLKYEISDEGFAELEKMYMACSLDKDTFAQLVKQGAKMYKVETKVTEVTYKTFKIEFVDWMNMWRIDDSRCSQTYFDTLEDAKDLIDRYVR